MTTTPTDSKPTKHAGPRNGLGVTALVLGLLGLGLSFIPGVGFLGIIGVGFGIAGLLRIRKGRADNKTQTLWGLGLSAAAVIAAIITIAVVATVVNDASDSLDQAINPTTTRAAPQTTPTTPAEVEPSFDTPKASDFTLKVVESERHCFGSAGCNVTFDIDAGWAQSYDPDITYEVTYKITGGENTYTNSFEVTGDEYSVDSEEMISTASDRPLKAKVIRVREV